MSHPADYLERLYREAGPAVWSYLRGRVRLREDADELLQETFVVAAGDYSALAAATSPRAWLLGIARNLAREHARRADVRRAESLTKEPESNEAGTAAVDELDAFQVAIAGLPEPQREVLELRLRDDLSYAEIAEALIIPIGTVRSRLHHALRALREWANRAIEGGAER